MPKVINIRDLNFKIPENAVYIGRENRYHGIKQSPFYNPYHEHHDGSREEVIEKFRRYILSNPELLAKAKRELRGKNLVCWCKPAACHGDVLLELVNEMEAEKQSCPECSDSMIYGYEPQDRTRKFWYCFQCDKKFYLSDTKPEKANEPESNEETQMRLF